MSNILSVLRTIMVVDFGEWKTLLIILTNIGRQSIDGYLCGVFVIFDACILGLWESTTIE
jgi:uncharacterized membrane protein